MLIWLFITFATPNQPDYSISIPTEYNSIKQCEKQAKLEYLTGSKEVAPEGTELIIFNNQNGQLVEGKIHCEVVPEGSLPLPDEK